jgi:hypothetical protein
VAEEKSAQRADSEFAAHVHNDEKDRHIDIEAKFTDELAEVELKLHVRKDPEAASIGEELRTHIIPLVLKGMGIGAAGQMRYGVPTSADGAVHFRPAGKAASGPSTKREPGSKPTEVQVLVQDIVGGILPLDQMPPGTLDDIERVLRAKTTELRRLVEIFETEA